MNNVLMNVAAGLTSIFLTAGPARASVDPPENHPSAVAGAMSFASAVKGILDCTDRAKSLIGANTLAEVHYDSVDIAALAKELPSLATRTGSGVPAEKLPDIAALAGKIVSVADQMHYAADDQRAAQAKTHLAELLTHTSALAEYLPVTFVCPMFCEKSRAYDAPGTCPVCQMALKKITAGSYAVEVKPLGGALSANKQATLVFTLKDPLGAPVGDLDIVHEKILHLLMVSKDLSWYAHEHPERQPDGSFVLAFTFPHPGEYVLYHDFTPPGVGMQVVPVRVTVPGTAPKRPPVNLDAGRAKSVDGYTFTFEPGMKVPLGSATITYTVERGGAPVRDLEHYLGALGHLIIVSEDLRSFVHSHPFEDPANPNTGPRVEFSCTFDRPGVYKAWGQFQHQGKILTVPFTFVVTNPVPHVPGPAVTPETQPPRGPGSGR